MRRQDTRTRSLSRRTSDRLNPNSAGRPREKRVRNQSLPASTQWKSAGLLKSHASDSVKVGKQPRSRGDRDADITSQEYDLGRPELDAQPEQPSPGFQGDITKAGSITYFSYEVENSWNFILTSGLTPALIEQYAAALSSTFPAIFSLVEPATVGSSPALFRLAQEVVAMIGGGLSLIEKGQEGNLNRHIAAHRSTFTMFGDNRMNLDRFAEAFIQALAQVLDRDFTPEVSRGWRKLWDKLTEVMADINYQIDEIPPEFTGRNLGLVQEAWEVLKKQELEAGVTHYEKFFELEPTARNDFNLGGSQATRRSKKMKKVSLKMMKAFTHLIMNLGHWESQKELLAKLSEFHFKKTITFEKYVAFGKASWLMIEYILGDGASPELQKAWNSVYSVLMSTMLRMQLEASNQTPLPKSPKPSELQPEQANSSNAGSSGQRKKKTVVFKANSKDSNIPSSHPSFQTPVSPDPPSDAISPFKQQKRKTNSSGELILDQEYIHTFIREESGQIEEAEIEETLLSANRPHHDPTPAEPETEDNAVEPTQDDEDEHLLSGRDQQASSQEEDERQEEIENEDIGFDFQKQPGTTEEIEPEDGKLIYDNAGALEVENDEEIQGPKITNSNLNPNPNPVMEFKMELVEDTPTQQTMNTRERHGSMPQIITQRHFEQHEPSPREAESKRSEVPLNAESLRGAMQSIRGAMLEKSSIYGESARDGYSFAGESRGSPAKTVKSSRPPSARDFQSDHQSHMMMSASNRDGLQTATTKKSMKSIVDTVRESSRASDTRRALLLSVPKPIGEIREQKRKQRELRASLRKMDDAYRRNAEELISKQVDFHHKIAYRFEKAYFLRKRLLEGRRKPTLEIVDCIREFSWFIEQDEASIFFGLYFCIYYNIPELVELFRSIIQVVEYQDPQTDQILEAIDVYSISRLRHIGDPANQVIYHTAFYRAFEENLRVVYFKILKQLHYIQLRDRDALKLIVDRDYELIDIIIGKYTARLNISTSQKDAASGLKSNTYKKYNRAYFEEIIINNEIEPRVAADFRRRYLKTSEDLLNVFEMYCKEDYEQHFLESSKEQITRENFLMLFEIALHNDSWKIASLIYLNHLSPSDFSGRLINMLIDSLRESCRLHEAKLFMIFEHFDELSVPQLDKILNIYQLILSCSVANQNPLISQFNPIKVTLLIYRVCWLIEEKKIYSLVTKCQSLQTYLIRSLMAYFDHQTNVLWLRNLMMEPILSTSVKRDSLDLMYEMSLKDLLQHPIVVDVINLIYQGTYSISLSPLAMSKTFNCAFNMGTTHSQSIAKAVKRNISTFGEDSSDLQCGMSFHVWKECTYQRQQDEMIFISIFSLAFVTVVIFLNNIHISSSQKQKELFGGSIYSDFTLLTTAEAEVAQQFCLFELESSAEEHGYMLPIQLLAIVLTLGHFSSILQKVAVHRLGNNVKLDVWAIILDGIVCSSCLLVYYFVTDWNSSHDDRVGMFCSNVITMTEDEVEDLIHMSTLRSTHFKLNYTVAVCFLITSLITSVLSMARRTARLGPTLTLLIVMLGQIGKFFITFGLIFGIYWFISDLLGAEMRHSTKTFVFQGLDLFFTMNGASSIHEYDGVIGFSYITSYILAFQIGFLTLLLAMFINEHRRVASNIDAYQRLESISLKNASAYDRSLSGVTGTFFPLNILMLPFFFPVILLRNPRVSESVLKLQYGFMLGLYFLIAFAGIGLLVPFLYFKLVINSLLILKNNRKEAFRRQNVKDFATAVFVGPFLILVSLAVDFCVVPNALFKPAKSLTQKYDLYQEKMTGDEMVQLTGVLKKVEKKYNRRFKDVWVTCHQLMQFHTNHFQITENIHNFMCRGTMDIRDALSIIREYNWTKILSRQFAVPNESGKMKDSTCDFELIFNILFDIEVYNFMDRLLRYRKLGTLASKVKSRSLEVDLRGFDLDEYRMQEEKDESNGLEPTPLGPDGHLLHRNKTDYVNNVRIDISCRSFLQVEWSSKGGFDGSQNKDRAENLKSEVEKSKEQWMSASLCQMMRHLDGFICMGEQIAQFKRGKQTLRRQNNTRRKSLYLII